MGATLGMYACTTHMPTKTLISRGSAAQHTHLHCFYALGQGVDLADEALHLSIHARTCVSVFAPQLLQGLLCFLQGKCVPRTATAQARLLSQTA